MALNDWRCSNCGGQRLDVFTPLRRLPAKIDVGGYWTDQVLDPPVCCFVPMTSLPHRVAVDAYEPFQEFTVEREGVTETVDSLHKLRQIEADSERRERNGEGQIVVWRNHSQNDSNRDVNVFGATPQQPVVSRNSRGMPYITRSGLLKDHETEHGR